MRCVDRKQTNYLPVVKSVVHWLEIPRVHTGKDSPEF